MGWVEQGLFMYHSICMNHTPSDRDCKTKLLRGGDDFSKILH